MAENRKTISLVMIAKNEAKGLERAILSCKDFVDQILISVDTKSNDATLDIAKKYANVLIQHVWEDDFSKARNNLQQYVKTDWSLMLDGHEYVKEAENLNEYLNSDADGLFVRIDMEDGFSFYFPRIYKSNILWKMPVHNYPDCKIKKMYKGFVIAHDRQYFQSAEAIKERIAQRREMVTRVLGKNIKENKKDARSLFYLAQEYRLANEWNKATDLYLKYLKYSVNTEERWLACYYLGFIANMRNKPKEAVKYFNLSDKELPGRWETAKRLGGTYMLLSKWNEALKYLVESLGPANRKYMFNPEKRNNAQVWFFISQCFYAVRKYEEGRIALKRALTAQTDLPSGQLPEVQRRIAEEILGAQNAPSTADFPKATGDVLIEVCFLVYKRFHRLPEILKELNAQTYKNFRVNIWNNSGHELDISSFPKERITVYDSPTNAGSKARFQLAKKTTGNPIIFFDDDEHLYPDFVEYHYKQYLKFGPKCILGYFSRTFNKGSYLMSKGAVYGEEVDYLATKAMILDRKIIDEEPLLQNIPVAFEKVEDLYLCYLARMKYGIRLVKINPASFGIVDNYDQWSTIDKEEAFLKLRQLGWWVLNDSVRKFGNYKFKIRKGCWDDNILYGEQSKAYYRIPENPRVVVDLGAHIGGTSILCAGLGAEVYAYEPIKENYDLLCENVKLNGFSEQIHCYKKGVGYPGVRKLYLNPKNSGMACFSVSSGFKEYVDIISINEVLRDIPECDFLKIDVEGAEYEFINDLPFEKIAAISLELHKGDQEMALKTLKEHYTVETKPAIDGSSLMVFCIKK